MGNDFAAGASDARREIVPQGRNLDLPKDLPVKRLCRQAFECEAAGGPKADEIRRDAESVAVVDPGPRNVSDQASRQIGRGEHKKHCKEHPPRESGDLGWRRGGFVGGANHGEIRCSRKQSERGARTADKFGRCG